MQDEFSLPLVLQVSVLALLNFIKRYCLCQQAHQSPAVSQHPGYIEPTSFIILSSQKL